MPQTTKLKDSYIGKTSVLTHQEALNLSVGDQKFIIKVTADSDVKKNGTYFYNGTILQKELEEFVLSNRFIADQVTGEIDINTNALFRFNPEQFEIYGSENIEINGQQIAVPLWQLKQSYADTLYFAPTAPPSFIADNTANTLDITHGTLADSEILLSINDGAYSQFNGAVINVGNINRVAGYYKAKIKAATGRRESVVVNSPAFTLS